MIQLDKLQISLASEYIFGTVHRSTAYFKLTKELTHAKLFSYHLLLLEVKFLRGELISIYLKSRDTEVQLMVVI